MHVCVEQTYIDYILKLFHSSRMLPISRSVCYRTPRSSGTFNPTNVLFDTTPTLSSMTISTNGILETLFRYCCSGCRILETTAYNISNKGANYACYTVGDIGINECHVQDSGILPICSITGKPKLTLNETDHLL